MFCPGAASGQSAGRAAEPAAQAVPQEKARLAASLFGNSSAAEPARARRSPNKQVGHFTDIVGAVMYTLLC